LARARRHDEEAVALLYQRALPTIYRYVLARSQRPDLAEDIVADVFLTMVERIDTLRATHEAGFFAWLMRIAQHKVGRVLQHITQQARQQTALELDQDMHRLDPALVAHDLAGDPQAQHEWREIVRELGLALETLSENQQIVIIGRFLEGYSIEDLARGLGKQPGAIRVIQVRALDALARQLGVQRRPRAGSKGGPRP
jgi:RNA polymerase sigma-70 factor (ECF subfamily)